MIFLLSFNWLIYDIAVDERKNSIVFWSLEEIPNYCFAQIVSELLLNNASQTNLGQIKIIKVTKAN